jgi:ribonuclease P protein subunit POP4
MMTERNLTRHELIGLPVQVVRCTDSSISGVSGKVVDETRNMLVVRRDPDGRQVRVAKDCCTFRFGLPGGGSADVDGRKIRFRPEDRVKKCR